jgi:hypothetical protein
MVLENDFKICYTQRNLNLHDIKSKEQLVATKDAEILFLKERLKAYEKQGTFDNQISVFETEMKIIREKLIEKTNEFLKFENYHKEVIKTNKEKVNEIEELQQFMIDENLKMKGIILDLIKFYKQGNSAELNNILGYLFENANDFEEKNPQIEHKKSKDPFDEFPMEGEEGTIEEDNAHGQFVQKVIGEFDKILNAEFKRVQRYYNKEPIQKQRKSSVRPIKKTSEKNYVEWKSRSSSANFMESLRGDRKSIEPSLEQSMYRGSKLDINDLAQISKKKIRSSIGNIGVIYQKTNQDEQLTKSNHDISSSEMFNFSQIYENKIGKSQSPVNKKRNKETQQRE